MHPPGLNLDFLFGRGYLSAHNLRVGEWATVESMRMEIPDLTFPFDARGGVGRFRNTRCQLRQLRLVLSESGMDSLLSRAVDQLQGFEELRVRFVEGAAHVTTRVRTLGSDTFLTFRVAAIPPEPPRGDAIHLFIHDVRPYGPLPYPARLLVAELITRLMATPTLLPGGTGPAFEVAARGDLVELRPIKLCLVQMFPRFGWKLPSTAGLRFESLALQPGAMTLAVRGDERPWERDEPGWDALAETAATRAGALALAAYEARDLLHDADQALFEGSITAAVERLRGLRERYGLHPAIAEGLLDILLASPGPGHVAEAQGIVDELLRAEPENLRALLAAPTLCLLRGDQSGAVRAYALLAAALRERGEGSDLTAALLAGAMVQRRHDTGGAIKALREVTRLAPRNRIALELLRDLYAQSDEVEARVDILRQLAGLYTERDALLEVYQQLAELLMERRNDLTEARLFLEKVLRLDPGHLQALFTLGESYVLDGQPLRAIRAFGSAARAAQERGDLELAAELHVKNADLWRRLEDFNSALLECRRALSLAPAHRRGLELAVELARDHGSVEEVLHLLDQLVPLVEEATARGPDQAAAAGDARRVHVFAAEVYTRRGRADTAAAHHRKALTWRRLRDRLAGPEPGDALDPSVEFLDSYYRQMGKPEDLIELYDGEVAHGHLDPARQAHYHRTLASLFDQVLGLGSEAAEHLRRALDLDPDDDVARDAAVELLSRRQRHFELRDLLRDLHARARSRRARARALLELGRLHLHAIADAAEAARCLREAQAATPADPEIARALVEAERRLVEQHLHSAEAPRLLLRALERLAELATSDPERVEALTEAGDVALERLSSPEEALAAWRRAHQLLPSPLLAERVARAMRALNLSEPRPSERVRLTAAPLPAFPSREALDTALADTLRDEARRLVAPEVEPGPEPAPTLPSAPAVAAPTPPPAPEPEPEPEPEPDPLEMFRVRMQEVATKPASLATGLDVVKKLAGGALPQRRGGLPRLIIPEDAEDRPEEAPGSLLLTRPDLPAVAPSRDAILGRVAEARDRQDPPALRALLESLLSQDNLEPTLAARLHRELGMTLYFDLEDAAAAAPHLFAARDLDPDGAGQDFELLSTLEGIYEDTDDPAGLLRVYDAKLQQATHADMRVVYGLLKAELLWEKLGRPEDARDALNAVLAARPHSEPALRMLADLHMADGDVTGALALLRQIVAREPAGTFERMEGLRELGRTLVQHADTLSAAQAAPLRSEAVEVYRALQAESAGESEPLVRLRLLLEQLERWDEALALLGAELGLLLGRPGAFPDGPPAGLPTTQPPPAALAVPTSQILADAAALHLRAERLEAAADLYAAALVSWPENVEALNARIDLLRRRLAAPQLPAEARAALARALVLDLEALTDLLFAPADRFQTLVDAAEIVLLDLDEGDRAQELLAQALALVEPLPQRDPDLQQRVDATREMLRQLQRRDEPQPTLLGERRDDFGVGAALSASLASLLGPGPSGAGGLPRRTRPASLPTRPLPARRADEDADADGWPTPDEAPLDLLGDD